MTAIASGSSAVDEETEGEPEDSQYLIDLCKNLHNIKTLVLLAFTFFNCVEC